MARRIRNVLTCDFTGEESEDVATIAFSARGQDFLVEANPSYQEAFDAALAPFIERARQTGGPRRRSTADRNRAGEIRAWAARNGIELADKGRIPADVARQYDSR